MPLALNHSPFAIRHSLFDRSPLAARRSLLRSDTPLSRNAAGS
jgi:hypothetical protein